MKTDKYISIEGPDTELITKAIQQLANIYSETEFVKGLRVFKSTIRDNLYILNFTNEPDFERFKYFVNYLEYPENISYKAMIRGYWTISENDKVPQQYIGKRLMLYVSQNDKEFDNVFGVFDGQKTTIKFGFAVGENFKVLKNFEMDFLEPVQKLEDFKEILVINPDPNKKIKKGSGCMLTILALLLFAGGLIIIIK